MQINELLDSITVAVTNEEQDVLDKMQSVAPMQYYDERSQFIIENLIKKNLVSKVVRNKETLVIKNDFKPC
jgi:hypothetical protein